MSVADFRDIMIGIVGVLITIILIGVAVGGLIVFLRVKSIMNSIKRTLKNVENITQIGSKAARPLVILAAIIEGVSRGIRAFRKDKGGNHGKRGKS